MVRKRTGRVQFLVLLRLWTGPPQNNNNNKQNEKEVERRGVFYEQACVWGNVPYTPAMQG